MSSNLKSDEDLLNDIEEVDEISVIAPLTEEEKNTPRFGREGWSDYVLSLLLPHELEKGCPKCDGLRRLCEELIGPIMDVRIVRNQSLKIPSDIATVVVGIKVYVDNPLHPLHEVERTIYCEDISDCGIHNTDPQYAGHASATAATRAEARVLRKLLRLSGKIAAEEDAPVNEELLGWKPSEPIDEAQINVMNVLCKRLDISVLDLIRLGSEKYDSVFQVTKDSATKMIKYLSDIQRGTVNKPTTLNKYDNNWREQ